MPPLLLLSLLGCPKPEALVEAMTSEESRGHYAEVVADPRIQAAVRGLVTNVTDGALDAMTEPQRAQALKASTGALVDELSDRLEADLREDIGPALRDEITKTLSASLATMLSDGTRRDSQALARDLTAAAVDAFSKHLAEGMRKDLGPATQEVIEKNLAPAMSAALVANGPVLAEAAHVLAKELADGLGESLGEDGELGKALDRREERMRDDVTAWRALVAEVGVVAVGLLALATVLAFTCVRLLRRSVAAARERDDREEALIQLATAVKDVEHTEAGRYVAARMRQRDNTRAGYAFKRLIEQNPRIRVEPGEVDPRAVPLADRPGEPPGDTPR